MKHIILLGISALMLSACSMSPTETNIASLYTGEESGSWYSFSRNCSAQLCAPN